MQICATCGRDYATRECSDPAHRAAHGHTEKTELELHGHRECVWCHELKPLSAYVGRSGYNQPARQYVTCGTCRFKNKSRRRNKKSAIAKRERAAVDAYWNQQARATREYPTARAASGTNRQARPQ